jgi:hypothetical protein
MKPNRHVKAQKGQWIPAIRRLAVALKKGYISADASRIILPKTPSFIFAKSQEETRNTPLRRERILS